MELIKETKIEIVEEVKTIKQGYTRIQIFLTNGKIKRCTLVHGVWKQDGFEEDLNNTNGIVINFSEEINEIFKAVKHFVK